MTPTSRMITSLCGKKIRNRFSVEERAVILCEMVDDIDIGDYDIIDKNYKFAGANIKKAISDIRDGDNGIIIDKAICIRIYDME